MSLSWLVSDPRFTSKHILIEKQIKGRHLKTSIVFRPSFTPQVLDYSMTEVKGLSRSNADKVG